MMVNVRSVCKWDTRPRIYCSESQKALMWERWQKGDSLQQIAQLFDRDHSSVQGILVQTGGIRPARRQRASSALTSAVIRLQIEYACRYSAYSTKGFQMTISMYQASV